MISTGQQFISQAVIGLLACILLGGTIALLLMGRAVPEFLVGFDGVIVTAAFAGNAFFVQARTALPTANALATAMDQHHALAMAGAKMLSNSTVPSTIPTGATATGSTAS